MAVTKLSNSGIATGGVLKYDSMLAGNPPFNPVTPLVFESIATVTVGSGGVNSITFSSIPSTYKHLQLRGYGTGFTNTPGGSCNLRFNGDSGTNYSQHALWGDGSAASQTAGGANSQILFGLGIQQGSTPCSWVCDILDYADTTKNKVIKTITGVDTNGGGLISIESGAWYNTSAINSILISNQANQPDNRFTQYSHFALYGIKGA